MSETLREPPAEPPDLDRPWPGTLRLAVWSAGPFAPAAFDPAARAAVVALLQCTDVLALGTLAAPGARLDELLREAGPEYHFLCPPGLPGEPRPASLYDATRVTPSGMVDLAQMPGWAGPRSYITEFRLHQAHREKPSR